MKMRYPRDIIRYNKVIKFNTDNPKVLPILSRDYLVLHAACTNILHLSGAAKYIDSVIREMEETLVLFSDGASAAVLEHVIWTAQCKLDPNYCSASESVSINKEFESEAHLGFRCMVNYSNIWTLL